MADWMGGVMLVTPYTERCVDAANQRFEFQVIHHLYLVTCSAPVTETFFNKHNSNEICGSRQLIR